MRAAWLFAVAAMACGRRGFAPAIDEAAVDAPRTVLVAHYPFDGDARDVSGNGIDAPCSAGWCASFSPGRIGLAADFDGIDDRYAVSDGRFDLLDGFTIALWVRVRRAGTFDTAISKVLATGRGASFELALPPDTVHFCTTTSSSVLDERCLSASQMLVVNAWTHLAMSWDGNDKRLYFDGTLRAAESERTIFDGSELIIGGDAENGGFRGPWPGSIDDLRIYRGALTDAEVAALAAP